MAIPRKMAKAAIVKNPNAPNNQIAHKLGIAERTVAAARAELIAEGVLQPNRRVPEPKKEEIQEKIAEIPTAEATEQPLTEENEKQLLSGRTLKELSDDEAVEDLENDEETRRKLLKIIKNIAFSPKTHPDTRITAIQAWTKLRDIAKTKELGPGLPLSETDVLTRLIRIYKGVGPTLAIKAMELAFSVKEPQNASDETNQQDPTPSRTEETSIST